MELLQTLKLQDWNGTWTVRLFRWLLCVLNWLFCCRGCRQELSADISLAPGACVVLALCCQKLLWEKHDEMLRESFEEEDRPQAFARAASEHEILRYVPQIAK